MSITHILNTANPDHIRSAQKVTSDCLHVPISTVSAQVAVGYIQRHYGEGRVGGPESQGWEGFVQDLATA